jgi:16S rRNA (uracil1498-N3)-methyltransferase
VENLSKQLIRNKSYHVLIGPEGDFTSTESADLLRANWTPFSLGKSILRTETACIAATMGIHMVHEQV